MKRVKIVREFFGIAAAKAQATWQRAKAKKDGRQILKIEIVPAYELFKTNGWFKNNPFKKIGIPSPGQFMVIVHFIPTDFSVPMSESVNNTPPKTVAASAPCPIGLFPQYPVIFSLFDSDVLVNIESTTSIELNRMAA